MIENDAISAFNSEMYYEALGLFTKALHQNKTLTLLDGRAATFEKIGKYESALKDSYRMIRFYPRCIDGYLRAGKILRLMNNYNRAIYIYKLGIKCSSYDSKKNNLLRKMLYSTLKSVKNLKVRIQNNAK
ncbi:uncharacterized protein T551_00800 [Pneumocystis jirovecii RU7]|uniref:Uncharacterized protein n=1 Tax=Pneumocystis jirovecii (strain RU7) TaxID=1408657 RepID=A0A0W4ZUQ3_PNEJ7|nr:uncharacterized protein T551_00800 [Pneumocystis jirovecii RU7]KTW32118.1 hypothetical protein T551_00800 [Pneumocystis jirovecii RU7]